MGGNVFKDKTDSIKIQNIEPTLNQYFAELKALFPKKAFIFNSKCFISLGSVGKKPTSGDIDLGIDIAHLLDFKNLIPSINEWGLNVESIQTEMNLLQKRARTSTPEQCMIKAFLKILTEYINSHAPNLYCDENKVTAGNIFGLFPQYNPDGTQVGIGVQIDWMVGDIEWIKFSYYSSSYPVGSNVKGLHRTQLMLAAFQVANLSFNHTSGVKDKDTGLIIATTPEEALVELNSRLKTHITISDAAEYYKLQSILEDELRADRYSLMLDTYFKILESTRCDIPDNLQFQWKKRKDRLGLMGKFLPDNSALKGL